MQITRIAPVVEARWMGQPVLANASTTGLGFANLAAASNSMNAATRPPMIHPAHTRPLQSSPVDVASHNAPIADCIASLCRLASEPFCSLADIVKEAHGLKLNRRPEKILKPLPKCRPMIFGGHFDNTWLWNHGAALFPLRNAAFARRNTPAQLLSPRASFPFPSTGKSNGIEENRQVNCKFFRGGPDVLYRASSSWLCQR